MATGNRMTVIKLEDWAKVDVDEIRKRWAKRRRKIEEVEKKKIEREKRIVKITRSGLDYFLFSPYFLFSLDLFSVFLFLAPRVRVSDDIGHITQRKTLKR